MGRQRMLWANAVLTVVYNNGSIQENNDFKLESRGDSQTANSNPKSD